MGLDRIMDVFASRNLVQQTTSALLEPLKADLPEHGPLQTKLLEMNLRNSPQVAEAILANRIFSHFDRQLVARLCETARLHQRALELYTEDRDIQRVLSQAENIDPEWLIRYLEPLPLCIHPKSHAKSPLLLDEESIATCCSNCYQVFNQTWCPYHNRFI